MDQIKIGKFISELRKEEGLTQIELGEKLGVSNKAVSKWENGKCLPDPSLYEPLCSILHISLTELFNGERIKKEEVLEKSDQILNDVMQHAKSNKILDFISSILIVSAIILFFIPTLKEFDQTLSIITILIGLLLLTLGLSLKLNEDEIEELLNSASYSLPKNNIYDLIIRFCFVEKIYNIKDVNELLAIYNCKLFSY